MPNRRTVLGGLGAMAVAWSRPARAEKLRTIGLQLYTVRRNLEKDFE